MIHWLTDWLTNWLILLFAWLGGNWLMIEWLTDWRLNWWIDSLICLSAVLAIVHTTLTLSPSLLVPRSGYGHLAPSTPGGRIFCMVFALLGIPLNLMVLRHIGDRVHEWIHDLHYYVETHIMGKEVKTLATKKLLWTLALLLVMLFLGAVLYSQTEHWSFLDGVYFCFVTFATIGFGDLVPNKGERRTPGGGGKRGGGNSQSKGQGVLVGHFCFEVPKRAWLSCYRPLEGTKTRSIRNWKRAAKPASTLTSTRLSHVWTGTAQAHARVSFSCAFVVPCCMLALVLTSYV